MQCIIILSFLYMCMKRLHGFKSPPLATVIENTAAEFDDSYVFEKPQPTIFGTEKSLPLATVIENAAAETDVSYEVRTCFEY